MPSSDSGSIRAIRRRDVARGPAIQLDTPLRALPGIGPRRAADLQRVGLITVEDLMVRFPLRYEDRAHLVPIGELHEGTIATVAGEVVRCGLRSTRRPGYTLYELTLRDSSGTLTALWFNQRFLRDVFSVHDRVLLFGRIERRGSGALQVTNPQYEIMSHARPQGGPPSDSGAIEEWNDTIHAGRIVPVHERVGTLTPKMQRSLVHRILQNLPTELDEVEVPESVRARLGLPGRRQAMEDAQFPPPGADLERLNAFRTPAQVRLVFGEFFQFQLGILAERRDLDRERKPHTVTVDDRIRGAARRALPFKLTPGQREALKTIVADMQRSRPMNRLLQGDVGAGKTIVALLSAIVAMENGLQAAVMAPTEILAEQHFRNLSTLLAASRHRVALLTGSTPPVERRAIQAALESGHVHLVVGTHALVQEGVHFRALALVIVDEQHRFGVLQRATLRDKAWCPDVLVMTATPIPRTLALTLHGDLDVSVIRDRPPGRTAVSTTARPETRREEVHAFVREQLDAGRQAYVIYPLVEESDKVDLRAAIEMADHLASEVFPAFRVGLLHGRMKSGAKDRVMHGFASGEIQVLVSTTVVEVGVDVPNATVMVVEHADRFGLVQLHQLRGRVGRGSHESYCVLLYRSPLSDEARERLKVLTETNDGFVIAEKDLELRGPGDFFGTRQSGRPTFRAGDLRRDRDVLELARREAESWIGAAAPGDPCLGRARSQWQERFGLAGVG